MRKQSRIGVMFLIVSNVIQGALIGSLLSWSNVPEPAKTHLGWLGVVASGLCFFTLFMVMYDEN